MSSWLQSGAKSMRTTWTLQVGTLAVVVTRHIDLGPNEWLIRYHPDITQRRVSVHADVEKAKIEALDIAYEVLSTMLKELESKSEEP